MNRSLLSQLSLTAAVQEPFAGSEGGDFHRVWGKAIVCQAAGTNCRFSLAGFLMGSLL